MYWFQFKHIQFNCFCCLFLKWPPCISTIIQTLFLKLKTLITSICIVHFLNTKRGLGFSSDVLKIWGRRWRPWNRFIWVKCCVHVVMVSMSITSSLIGLMVTNERSLPCLTPISQQALGSQERLRYPAVESFRGHPLERAKCLWVRENSRVGPRYRVIRLVLVITLLVMEYLLSTPSSASSWIYISFPNIDVSEVFLCHVFRSGEKLVLNRWTISHDF